MNRLRVQLVLAFTLVVLIAVGAIAILVVRTTDIQFRRYITHSGMQASGSGLRRLVAYYDQQGSWEGVDRLLAGGVFLGEGGMMAGPAAMRGFGWAGAVLDVLLARTDGRVVYDSAGQAEGRRLTSAERSQALPIARDDGEVIGYLLFSLPSGYDRLGGLEQQFLRRMQRILIAGAGLAVTVGLAVGIVLSRSFTAPLQRLATAVRAVSAGDLGQRVRAEGSAEMVEVAQAFNEMTANLAKSERQRQHMVADVAHELRTPLTVLQGNLRAILDGVYPTDQAEIARLYDETRLLGRLVDDLRELALADAGQLRLNLHDVDIRSILGQTVDSLSPAAAAQEVALTAQLPETLPHVQADPDRLAQVMRNLLINALRHTPAGGSVTVSARYDGKAVEVAVMDTGEGIAPQDLPHVFERFWRADPARARTGGTGLGLSVVQSLVEAQGGRIWAESAPGQGSRFRFTVPVARGTA